MEWKIDKIKSNFSDDILNAFFLSFCLFVRMCQQAKNELTKCNFLSINSEEFIFKKKKIYMTPSL